MRQDFRLIKKTLLATSLIVWAGLSACGERVASPAPVTHLGLKTAVAGAITVQEGDNLFQISKRYRLPLRDIIDANDIDPPYRIGAGQRLKMPLPVEYTVQHNDTLYAVSRLFGVDMAQLAKTNEMKAPYNVKVGQALRIPTSYRRHEEHLQKEVRIASTSPRNSKSVISKWAEKEKQVPKRVTILTPPPQPSAVVKQPQTTVLSSRRPDFVWPLKGKVISGYGPKQDGLQNDGINIAAPKGTPVRAAADGVVAYVGDDLESYGNLVLVRHGGGMVTAYAHLSSATVREGMPIRKGQAIGTVGSTGTVATSQLHFEIRQGSKTFDPKHYLG